MSSVAVKNTIKKIESDVVKFGGGFDLLEATQQKRY